MPHNGDEPDPLFSCGYPARKRVTVLTIVYENDSKEVLEFPESNMPFYLVKANYLQRGDTVIKQFYEHTINWTENHWSESDVGEEIK